MSEPRRRNSDAQSRGLQVAVVAAGALVITSVGAVFGYLFGRKHEQAIVLQEEERASQRRSADRRSTLANSACVESTGSDGATVCSICMGNVANILFLPCSHLCSCPACARQLARGGDCFDCPVCKQQVCEVRRVFPQY